MVYIITGKDKRYGMKHTYGMFSNLRECLKHMETLKRSYGNMIKFKYEEVR